ncbi:MAG: T9SS type A sorting domain-containing protein, partial [Ignavibacteriaceae bacterium]|nr:T9SS type A sorting domain-containing protein [Ignavibacteriaceae bacterium]
DVIWGTDGTLPVTATMMDYAGTNPPNATSGNPNAQYRNEYSRVKLYGGNGYTYALRQYLDPSKQGKITNAYNQKLASWTGSEWGVYTSTSFNPSYGYLRTNYIQYAPEPNLESNATYLFAVTSSDNPLPVELSSFTAIAHQRDAELRWTTITEFNLGYFEIERHNSSGIWVPVARMNAAGMSNSIKEYSYWDKRLNTGKFTYRLKCIDNNGEFSYSDLVEVEIDKPATFALMQNYPNPFNPETKIEFNLPVKALIRLELYNITGELVYIIRDNIFEPGFHSVLLNTNNVSRGLATGVYFYRMIALDENRKLVFMSVKKLLYLK